MLVILLIIFCCLLSSCEVAFAKPFIPQGDSIVLEHVARMDTPVYRRLEQLKTQAQKYPDNSEIALKLIYTYLNLARDRGEPVYAGYAEALLQRWFKGRDGPDAFFIARASIRQYNHDFKGALADLNHVLNNRLGNAQALLIRANIHRIQGRYKQASRDCQSLVLLTDSMVPAICDLSVAMLTGKAVWALRKLEDLLERNKDRLSPELRKWGFVVLGEGHSNIGNTRKAYHAFEQATADIKSADIYLKTAYLDLLLSEGKYQKVYEFVPANRAPDSLLLRKAISAKKLGAPKAQSLFSILRSRFKDNQLSGRSRHLREAALFKLFLEDNPDEALTLALQNWKHQREPIDTRLLLMAASRSGALENVRPVIEWVMQRKTEDVHINKLVAHLERRLK